MRTTISLNLCIVAIPVLLIGCVVKGNPSLTAKPTQEPDPINRRPDKPQAEKHQPAPTDGASLQLEVLISDFFRDIESGYIWGLWWPDDELSKAVGKDVSNTSLDVQSIRFEKQKGSEKILSMLPNIADEIEDDAIWGPVETRRTDLKRSLQQVYATGFMYCTWASSGFGGSFAIVEFRGQPTILWISLDIATMTEHWVAWPFALVEDPEGYAGRIFIGTHGHDKPYSCFKPMRRRLPKIKNE